MEQLLFHPVQQKFFPWRMTTSSSPVISFDSLFSTIINCHSGNLKDPFLKYKPSTRYLKFMLRDLLDYCEEHCIDIPDEVYSMYSLFLLEIDKKESFSFRSFLHPTNSNSPIDERSFLLHLKCSDLAITEGTTGLSIWPAAYGLCNYFVNNLSLFKSFDCIIEFGCGTGISGLVLGKLLATYSLSPSIVLTDCNESVIELANENICINELHNANGIVYSWTDPIDTLLSEIEITNSTNSLLIASDIVFDPELFDSLVLQLNTFVYEYNGKILFSSVIRNDSTWNLFCQLLHSHNLSIVNSSVESQLFFPFLHGENVKIFWIEKAVN